MKDPQKLPKISIVTPSFNQGKFLEETIRSVLLQEYPNLEYIIIDGGSSDNSSIIIEKYAPWLAYYVIEPDQGQSDAINKGFKRCTGDIITFQNSDDIYLPGALWAVAAAFQEHLECGAIAGGFTYMDRNSNLAKNPVPAVFPFDGPVDLSIISPHIWRLHQAALFYTRTALDSVGRYVRTDFHFTLDRELLFRICRLYRVITRPEIFSAFRRHEDSKSSSLILPFAAEFARLYLDSRNNHWLENLRRRSIARFYLARGCFNCAKNCTSRWAASFYLLKTLFYSFSYLPRSSYWVEWSKILNIHPLLRQGIKSFKTTQNDQIEDHR